MSQILTIGIFFAGGAVTHILELFKLITCCNLENVVNKLAWNSLTPLVFRCKTDLENVVET